MKKLAILTFCILVSSHTFSQESYEILLIKGDYDQILQKSKDLNSASEYGWNSLALQGKGRTLDAIKLLRLGITVYPGDIVLEKLLTERLFETGQYVEAKSRLENHLDDPGMFLRWIQILSFESEYPLAIQNLKDKLKTTISMARKKIYWPPIKLIPTISRLVIFWGIPF